MTGRSKCWREYLKREIKDFRSLSLYRACAAEFLGVFLLVFYGVGCNILDKDQNSVSSVHVALETGFYIAVAITVFGNVSGGHVNPAISIGFFVTGQISTIRFFLYSIFQTLGGIAGAGILHMITVDHIRGGFGIILPNPLVNDTQVIFCELIITFTLLFVSFAVVDEGRNDIHGFAPLIIGLIVSVNVFSGWNISGGCMNPARNYGPAFIVGKLDKMWLYWVGDLVGAVLGALLYDRIFSTRVCLTWLSEGCITNREEKETKATTAEKEVVYIIDADRKPVAANGGEAIAEQDNNSPVYNSRL